LEWFFNLITVEDAESLAKAAGKTELEHYFAALLWLSLRELEYIPSEVILTVYCKAKS
jgi:hypothetical protein